MCSLVIAGSIMQLLFDKINRVALSLRNNLYYMIISHDILYLKLQLQKNNKRRFVYEDYFSVTWKLFQRNVG